MYKGKRLRLKSAPNGEKKVSVFSAGCGFDTDVENCWCCSPLPQAMVLERLAPSSTADHRLTCLVKTREGTFFFKKEDILCWRCPSEICSAPGAVAAPGRYGWDPDDLKASCKVCFIWEEACPLHPHYGLIRVHSSHALPLSKTRGFCYESNVYLWTLAFGFYPP